MGKHDRDGDGGGRDDKRPRREAAGGEDTFQGAQDGGKEVSLSVEETNKCVRHGDRGGGVGVGRGLCALTVVFAAVAGHPSACPAVVRTWIQWDGGCLVDAYGVFGAAGCL